jgi:hypothetical protein
VALIQRRPHAVTTEKYQAFAGRVMRHIPHFRKS